MTMNAYRFSESEANRTAHVRFLREYPAFVALHGEVIAAQVVGKYKKAGKIPTSDQNAYALEAMDAYNRDHASRTGYSPYNHLHVFDQVQVAGDESWWTIRGVTHKPGFTSYGITDGQRHQPTDQFKITTARRPLLTPPSSGMGLYLSLEEDAYPQTNIVRVPVYFMERYPRSPLHDSAHPRKCRACRGKGVLLPKKGQQNQWAADENLCPSCKGSGKPQFFQLP